MRSPRIRDNNPRPELIGHWFHYLRISPSYQLASKYRQGLLGEAEQASLPHDFDRVLQTYDDFGDVWNVDYWEWTKDKWRDLFDANVVMPQIKILANLLEGEHEESDVINKNLDHFLQQVRPATGFPPTFIMAIPANMNKKRILDEVSYALDTYKKAQGIDPRPQFVPKAKYVCKITKIRSSVLKLSYRIITTQSQRPKWKHWEVAKHLKISPSHTEAIVAAEQKRETENGKRKNLDRSSATANDLAVINAVVGRYIRHAFLIAENAARGNFPSLDNVVDAAGKQIKTHFDYAEVLRGVNLEIARQKLGNTPMAMKKRADSETAAKPKP